MKTVHGADDAAAPHVTRRACLCILILLTACSGSPVEESAPDEEPVTDVFPDTSRPSTVPER